jgi:molybdopterin converting factor small subunit
MKLQLHPYGPLIHVLGPAPVAVETPAQNAAELLEWLHAHYPGLQAWEKRIACAQGESLLNAASPLNADLEVALIPPVSGG